MISTLIKPDLSLPKTFGLNSKSSFLQFKANLAFKMIIKYCRLLLVGIICILTRSKESTNGKIAFLFLTRGEMPLEEVWREFFNWRASEQEYTIYIHPQMGFSYTSTSFFYRKETLKREVTHWGGISVTRAIKDLVREALLDPDNQWFCLMSESCIPIHSFPTWKKALFSQNKSIVNACWMDPKNIEVGTRWRPQLDEIGLEKQYFRKSATWFALNRKHAMVYASETRMDTAFSVVPCVDEHYLPTILAYNHLDNETTCSDGFVYHFFHDSAAAHPVTYTADNINAELFARLSQPVGQKHEFGQMCSGLPDVCHFTARKFSHTSKYAILEHMNMILDEPDFPYTGDPFIHIRSFFRKGETTKGIKYYLIETGKLREIPDIDTMVALHLIVNKSSPINPPLLTEEEIEEHPIGFAFPSRREGQVLKTARSNSVYLIQDGFKRLIPNWDTFVAMKLNPSNIRSVPVHDLEQISLGKPMPDLSKLIDRKLVLD
jgi:hypothetical protein